MEILILVLRIIQIILSGISSKEAVERVSQSTGSSFKELWDNLPDEYK